MMPVTVTVGRTGGGGGLTASAGRQQSEGMSGVTRRSQRREFGEEADDLGSCRSGLDLALRSPAHRRFAGPAAMAEQERGISREREIVGLAKAVPAGDAGSDRVRGRRGLNDRRHGRHGSRRDRRWNRF